MSETIENQKLANWLRINGYKFAKIPNETYTTSWNQKRKNKSEGVSAGLCDMMIITKSGSLIFIELKKKRTRKKNGEHRALSSDGIDISQKQIEWIDALNEIDNVEARVCFGFEEAREYVLSCG